MQATEKTGTDKPVFDWRREDVSSWLTQQNFTELRQAFYEGNIDGPLLVVLEPDDLGALSPIAQPILLIASCVGSCVRLPACLVATNSPALFAALCAVDLNVTSSLTRKRIFVSIEKLKKR